MAFKYFKEPYYMFLTGHLPLCNLLISIYLDNTRKSFAIMFFFFYIVSSKLMQKILQCGGERKERKGEVGGEGRRRKERRRKGGRGGKGRGGEGRGERPGGKECQCFRFPKFFQKKKVREKVEQIVLGKLIYGTLWKFCSMFVQFTILL